MKKNIRTMLGVLLAAGALAFAGAPAANAAPGGGSYTCTGGDISGTYSNVMIVGPCAVPQGATLTVTGNLTVASGAVFDAQTVSSTVAISKNVTAASGSFLGLGCQAEASVGNSAHPCADGGDAVISVGGNITANGAMAVMLNGISVERNVAITGGGSDVPWTIKNSTIGGNLTMSGQSTSWIGVLFNTIGRNATFTQIAINDPDGSGEGMYIGYNDVGHNLVCSGITPKVSPGFRPGAVNTVGHNATGQCAALI